MTTDPREPERTQELARAVRAGDGDSFSDLYLRVAPALAAWSSLRVKPALRTRLDPEDLVQEVCCRAYRDFGNYDPKKGVFRQWLFGIANTVLRSALAELARSPRVERAAAVQDATQLIDQVPADVTTASRRLARDERTTAVVDFVDSFEEQERALLVARGLEGLGFDEVADVLDVPRETAKKRWQRLRARALENGLPDALLVE